MWEIMSVFSFSFFVMREKRMFISYTSNIEMNVGYSEGCYFLGYFYYVNS